MGELIPVLAVMAIVLVIVVSLYARKGLNLKQVVKPVEEMDMVERIKIPLNPVRTRTLMSKLTAALEEVENSKFKAKTVVVDHPDTDDRIIRFVISKE